MTIEPNDTEDDVAPVVRRNVGKPAGKQFMSSTSLPALIESKRYYGGLSMATALWEWGQRSTVGSESTWQEKT